MLLQPTRMRLPPRGEGGLGKKKKKKKTKYDQNISHYSSFLGSKRTAKCYREKKKWNGGVKKEVKKQEKKDEPLGAAEVSNGGNADRGTANVYGDAETG